LDLIGAPETAFYSAFTQTDHIFDRLVEIEQRLRKSKVYADYSLLSG
jgi:hypothetical protein